MTWRKRQRSVVIALLVAASWPAVAQFARTPAPADEILYARRFTLEQPYTSPWHRDLPLVGSGYLVVLRVDPSLTVSRAGAMPVLFAGSATVERVNRGHPSGIVVGIVPGEVDLTQALVWFGREGYPDETTAGEIEQSRAEAIAAGVMPLAPSSVEQALAQGGSELAVADRAALLGHLALLVQQYAPGDE